MAAKRSCLLYSMLLVLIFRFQGLGNWVDACETFRIIGSKVEKIIFHFHGGTYVKKKS